ncbi:MAG TPA: type II toxin-antitoxin system RelE/ParE family toxin [Armatimonadota bacterium]|nr:type II toxin-antitoxin system RelE/ParE family toxin [Armatimonadota bacterium]
MSYRIRFHPAARKEFLALDRQIRDRISPRVNALADAPRPPHTERLRGTLRGLRKHRVGCYRVAYAVDDDAQVVTVTEVGHRRDICRRAARR